MFKTNGFRPQPVPSPGKRGGFWGQASNLPQVKKIESLTEPTHMPRKTDG